MTDGLQFPWAMGQLLFIYPAPPLRLTKSTTTLSIRLADLKSALCSLAQRRIHLADSVQMDIPVTTLIARPLTTDSARSPPTQAAQPISIDQWAWSISRRSVDDSNKSVEEQRVLSLELSDPGIEPRFKILD